MHQNISLVTSCAPPVYRDLVRFPSFEDVVVTSNLDASRRAAPPFYVQENFESEAKRGYLEADHFDGFLYDGKSLFVTDVYGHHKRLV